MAVTTPDSCKVLMQPNFKYTKLEQALPHQLGQALHALGSYIHSPEAMNVSILLSTISSLIQRFYVVERQPGLVYPVGLSTLIIADVSERKSSVEKAITKVMRDEELKSQAEYEVKKKHHRVLMEVHNQKVNLLYKKIKKAIAKEESTTQYETDLRELATNEPVLEAPLRFFISQSTFEKAISILQEQGGVGAWIISEGGAFFKSAMARHAPEIADAWSGSALQYETKTAGSVYIPHPKIVLSIAVQPDIFKEFMAAKGREWLATGLMSRFLICHPPSTKGTRFEIPDFQNSLSIEPYESRMKELMKMATSERLRNPTVLRFDPDARKEIINFSNTLESHIGMGGYLEDVSGAAGKMTENAARMAAVMHVFEGYSGNISLDITNRAIFICTMYMEEFKRLLGEIPLHNQIEEAAKSILRDMQKWYSKCPTLFYQKIRAARYGNTITRKCKDIREAAFQLLEQQGAIHHLQQSGRSTQHVGLTHQGMNQANCHMNNSLANLQNLDILQMSDLSGVSFPSSPPLTY